MRGRPRRRRHPGDRRGVDSPALLARQAVGAVRPVYALRSGRDWGAGDLADLKALDGVDWGAGRVAWWRRCPLLASSFGERADPSPYRPLSRLFWNEFFLAPEMTEEWADCEPARAAGGASGAGRRRDALRDMDAVDYQAVMALKRPVLEELARCFFDRAGDARRRDYEDYLARRTLSLRDYAAFRAADGGAVRRRGPAPGAQPGSVRPTASSITSTASGRWTGNWRRCPATDGRDCCSTSPWACIPMGSTSALAGALRCRRLHRRPAGHVLRQRPRLDHSAASSPGGPPRRLPILPRLPAQPDAPRLGASGSTT